MSTALDTITTVKQTIAAYRTQHPNAKVVATNGCFDLLHAGHVQYLQWAKAQGDFLVVLLNTDASVSALKGPSRPVNNEQNRMAVLAALRCVDAVALFSAESPIEELLAIHPDVYVKADQYNLENLPEAPALTQAGVEIRFAPMLQGISTTALIERAAAPTT